MKSEYRRAVEFAAILAFVGAVSAVVSFFRGHGTRAAVFMGLGLLALALALAARPVWLALFRLWMKLAEGIAWVMTRVILSLFYFVILTPFGWARRLTGNPTLDTAWRDGKSSYWIDKQPTERSLERYAKRY
jgi:hypothetical protein